MKIEGGDRGAARAVSSGPDRGRCRKMIDVPADVDVKPVSRYTIDYSYCPVPGENKNKPRGHGQRVRADECLDPAPAHRPA
ncbi:hypothetical protein J6590_012266 [Homalodisca vitripennis]|nr:hypothetical protein J6590_012266 [Homalodisca vitripennis]